jgi:hypothetical protein
MSWSPAVTGTLVIVVGLVAAGLTVLLRRRFPQLEEVDQTTASMEQSAPELAARTCPAPGTAR